MAKHRRRPRHRQTPLSKHPQQLPPGLPAQRHRHPRLRQEVQPPRPTTADTRRAPWPTAGSPAARNARWPTHRHLAVPAHRPDGGSPPDWQTRFGAVQRPKQKVARPVTRKHPPGPVTPMRRRSQHQPAAPEPRDRQTRQPAGPSTSRRGTPPASLAPPLPARPPAADSGDRHVSAPPVPPVPSLGRRRTRNPLQKRPRQLEQFLRRLFLHQVPCLADDSNLGVRQTARPEPPPAWRPPSGPPRPTPAAPGTACRQWRPHSPPDPRFAAWLAAPLKNPGLPYGKHCRSTSASDTRQESYRPSIWPRRTYHRCAYSRRAIAADCAGISLLRFSDQRM